MASSTQEIIRLTDAQLSALECSGIEFPEGAEEDTLLAAIRWGTRQLHFAEADRNALHTAIIGLCNAEDATAEDASEDPEARRWARGARTALTNLVGKL